MKTKIVTIGELTKDNPTLCMSPIRVLGECYKCGIFLSAFKRIKRQHPEITDGNQLLELTKKSLTCNPIIFPDNKERLLRFFELYQERDKITREIKKIAEEMGLDSLEGR